MIYESVFRIKVFTPPESVDQIISDVLKVVKLQYGSYDSVSWTSAIGIERFKPNKHSNPCYGQVGELSTSPSVRIEFSIPRDEKILENVIQKGIFPNHPWEEPVILISEERETRCVLR